MVLSGPHSLDKIHELPQTRVFEFMDFMLVLYGISFSPEKGSYFQIHQVDHLQYHDRIANSLENSYPKNSSANR